MVEIFSKYSGEQWHCLTVVSIYCEGEGRPGTVKLDLDASDDKFLPMYYTPAQAIELGKALIEAAKAQQKATKAVKRRGGID